MVNIDVSMFTFLSRLRRQPINVRKQIALLVAGGITFFIVLFWLTGIVGRQEEPEINIVDKKGPIATVGETLGALFVDVSDSFKSFRKSFSSEEIVIENTDAASLGGLKNDGI